MPGAEPLSRRGTTDVGVLVIHGFTGNPISMRGIADTMVAAGHHVEMPLLPGHGTAIEDMLDTTWIDWTAEVTAAHARLVERSDHIVVIGLSMGGALAGGLLLGVVEALGMHFTSPSLKSLLSYGIFIAVLLLRPNGLFHRKR